jgi:hypothetical protein
MAKLLAVFALVFALAPAAAKADMRFPMTFSSTSASTPQCGSRCPSVVVAEGVIEPETPEAFREFALREALSPDRPSLIYLDSPGGNVVASMELGDEFRRLRVTAIVPGMAAGGAASGQCASACVYTLMGAARRFADPSSRIGLHRMSMEPEYGSSDGRRFADARLVSIVAGYAARMGVSPSIVRMAETLPPDSVRILTAEEMRRSGLATVGARALDLAPRVSYRLAPTGE